LILPIGISFYTFHTLTYTIEIYRRKFEPTKDVVSFFLFVSIFPLAMSGPIERAPNLLPQIFRRRNFDYRQLTEGLRLVLWGLFMKVVVADRLGVYVDAVYNNAAHHNGNSLFFATLFFSFQIYSDFAGYSFMAIGLGRILGFNFLNNFNRPILAISVSDHWRRWHITLSKWFKDYVYIPLGGNRCSKNRNYLNLMIVFIISGIWHGANWTFIIWGGLNGIFQVIEKIFKKPRDRFDKFMNKTKPGATLLYILSIAVTFVLISMTRVFFRSDNLHTAFMVVKKIVTERGSLFANNIDSIVYGVFFILVLIFSDLLQERNKGVHFFLAHKNPAVRYVSYIMIILAIVLFGVVDSSQFIYFQF
jgi:D-alanyl-lipoteichoic acid acyltransferase DltB (MBOAT superfamily)